MAVGAQARHCWEDRTGSSENARIRLLKLKEQDSMWKHSWQSTCKGTEEKTGNQLSHVAGDEGGQGEWPRSEQVRRAEAKSSRALHVLLAESELCPKEAVNSLEMGIISRWTRSYPKSPVSWRVGQCRQATVVEGGNNED